MDKNHRAQDTRSATSAAGNLLKAPGLAALAVVFVLAAWYSHAGILLLAGLFLSTVGMARLWTRLSLAGVQVERSLTGTRFFPDEPIECRLRLFNRKPLPLPWIQLENDLPEGFRLQDRAGRVGVIRRTAALLWYRSIAWNLLLVGERRGYYPLAPVKLTSGDLLGLYARTRMAERAEHLIIYPRIYPVDTRRIPSLHPLGDFQTTQRLFRDPTRTIGVRDYLRSDSLKFIHWKATARRGDLQVKVLAATAALKVALFLDVESFRADGILREDEFELAISAAGSLAAALCERGSPVGLCVNTRLADTGQPAVLASAAGRGRITEVLETLAKVTGRSSGPLAALLEDERQRLLAGTTLVFILGRFPDTFQSRLTHLKTAGFRLLLLIVGSQTVFDPPADVPWLQVRHADDLAGGPRP